ncbi:3,4-dihydroxy-2-butanone 4-phosphate synthase [Gammaproteobacteria bacterium]
MPLSTIPEIIEDIRQGRMVILMDDENRENEGDLIMAASLVQSEDINFMARYGRGLICLTLTQSRCQQLRLPLMVRDTNDKHATNFTVSIEAAHGVTTGISAADRAHTVRTAVAAEARPEDLVHPGHIFPLMAQPGGVLSRAGHTEAGCDLARLAGLVPATVIVEILNEDGTMARRPDLEIFAVRHGLKMGTIADLIHYRTLHERNIERVAETPLHTDYGSFRLIAYLDSLDQVLHFALVNGSLDPDHPPLVRVHLQDDLCDLLGGKSVGCTWSLQDAMRRISQDGGVLVILRKSQHQKEIIHRIKDLELRERGVQLPAQERGEDLRSYGIGAQILVDLGVHRMRVLSSPKRVHALSGFGLEVMEYVGHD